MNSVMTVQKGQAPVLASVLLLEAQTRFVVTARLIKKPKSVMTAQRDLILVRANVPPNQLLTQFVATIL